MKIKNLKLKIGALALLSIFSFLLSAPAQADSSLSVSPAIISIEAIPPADARTPLVVENSSSNTVSLKVVFRPFRANAEDGRIVYLGEKEPMPGADPAIFEKIQLVDGNEAVSSFELGPRQKKRFDLRVIVPQEELFSDYYFSVIFLSSPVGQKDVPDIDKSNTSGVTGGIAANVLLSIGPKDKPKGYIEEFTSPSFLESGPVPFKLRLKNAGSHFIAPKGVIIIKNMFDQAVGRIEIPNTNVLAGTIRTLSNTKQDFAPALLWNEKFLLGFYTATLTLAVSEEGPLYTRSIHFTAFPSMLLLGIAVALILVVAIIIRVKKKMR